MRTLRGLSGTLKSVHQVVSTSDVPVVTRRHTRVGIRSARCAVRHHAPRGWWSGLDLRIEDPASPCRWEQDGQKPENAFHRIEHLQAV